jgi:hypothetical protein
VGVDSQRCGAWNTGQAARLELESVRLLGAKWRQFAYFYLRRLADSCASPLVGSLVPHRH